MALSNTQMTTGEVRLSYAHLYDPYSNNGGEPKYSVTVLMPKTDVQAKARLDAAVEAAKQKGIAEKWNGVLPPVVASAIHDGDGVRPNGEPFGAECKGHWVFTASSKNPVSLVDASMNPIVQKGELYSGCYARVCVSLFPYNSNGKRGIGIGLEAVQKLRDGDPLGGGVSVADAFGMAPVMQPATPANPMQQFQQSAPAQYQQPMMQYGAAPQQPMQYGAVDPITGQPL
jgi:hypothetical protein